jgi:hypothetical protein
MLDANGDRWHDLRFDPDQVICHWLAVPDGPKSTFFELAENPESGDHNRYVLKSMLQDVLLGKVRRGCVGANVRAYERYRLGDDYWDRIRSTNSAEPLPLAIDFDPLERIEIVHALADMGHRAASAVVDRDPDEACRVVAESDLPKEGVPAYVYIGCLAMTDDEAVRCFTRNHLRLPARLAETATRLADEAARPLAYRPKNIPIISAFELLRERGIAQPGQELLRALQDGGLPAEGLVDGTWMELPAVWWRHLSASDPQFSEPEPKHWPFDGNVVWFERKDTTPPTPFRAERIEVPIEVIYKLWPALCDDAAPARLEGTPLKLLGALKRYSNPNDWAAFMAIEREFVAKGYAVSIAATPVLFFGEAPLGYRELYGRRETALRKLDDAFKTRLRSGGFRITGLVCRKGDTPMETEIPVRQVAILHFGYASSTASGSGLEYSGVEVEEARAIGPQPEAEAAATEAPAPVEVTQTSASLTATANKTRGTRKRQIPPDQLRDLRSRILEVHAHLRRKWPARPKLTPHTIAAEILVGVSGGKIAKYGHSAIKRMVGGSYDIANELGLGDPWTSPK